MSLSNVIIPILALFEMLLGELYKMSRIVSAHFASIPLLMEFHETSIAKTYDSGAGGFAQYSYINLL